MIFFASDAMCHFRGGLVQCFGARAERTAGGIRVISSGPTLRDCIACAGLLKCGIFDAMVHTMVHKEKRIMPVSIEIEPSARV